MIDTIRSIPADVASGTIKDVKIVALSERIVELTSQLERSELQNQKTTAELHRVEAELVIHQPPERIETETEYVLNRIYGSSSKFTRKRLQARLRLAGENVTVRSIP